MIRRLLTAPFLLRRLVRSSERIAVALEDLIAIEMRRDGWTERPSRQGSEPEDGEGVIGYATDADSWEKEVREARRAIQE